VTGRPLTSTIGALAVVALAGFGGQRVLAHRASRATARARPSPACAPSQLNRSALLPGTSVSVSPLPDSLDASTYNQISFLGAPAGAIAGVSVSGSLTGSHSGQLRAYSQGDGASFVPSKPFRPGETVTVRGRVQQLHGPSVRFAFRFTVSEPDPLPAWTNSIKRAGKPGEVLSLRSRPDLHAPAVSVSASSPQTASGYVFAAPYSGPGQDGPMIFDSAGNLVWFHPLPSGVRAANLQVQQYLGRPVLTWWQGRIPPQGFGLGEEVIADSSYREIVRVHAGNGYQVDLHDFHLGANDTAVFPVFHPIRCNLSAVGGPSAGALTDSFLQEVDLATHLVRREWHGLDHIALSQTYSSPATSTTIWPLDYFHLNSIERRKDGSLLLSARNTSAVYIVDSATGQLALQIGGRHGGVRLGSGAGTAYQHDAQELPGGQISIFDNGGKPVIHPQSRGIVVSVNLKSRTDTLISQYEHPKPLAAASQGNLQPLENGDFFIGWGAQPYFSEFGPSGALLFDAHLPHGTESYRGYRFQWSATPYERPAIAAAPAHGGLTVYASWNGATNVASWEVFGGPSPKQLTPIATVARSGFETAIAVPGSPAYVAAQALDGSGALLDTSPTIKG
jgi:hypothetical protein